MIRDKRGTKETIRDKKIMKEMIRDKGGTKETIKNEKEM